MGFFKKIGSSIKKASKQVSFKNLVKVGTPLLGAIPLVGGGIQNTVQGLSDAHQMKKDAEAQNNAQMAYDAEVLKQQVYVNAGKAVGGVAGNYAGVFGNAVVNGAYDGLDQGFKKGLGEAGADVADFAIGAWFKKHWIWLSCAVVAIIGLVWYSKNNAKPKRKRAVR